MIKLQQVVRIAGLLVAMSILPGVVRAGEPELQKLKQGLQSLKEADRVQAIKQAKISTADAGKAAEILVATLADKSTQVQQAASAAILKLGKEAAPALAQALQSKDAKIRRASVSLLYQLGADARPASAALARLLRDPDAQMRGQAGDTLLKFGNDAAPSVLDLLKNVEDKKHWPVAVSLLQRIEGQTKRPIADFVPTMARHLDSKDPQARKSALTILQQLGPRSKEAAPAVAKLLADPDVSLRGVAGQLLLNFGPDAIPPLKAQLNHPSSDVRLATMTTLSRFGNRKQDVVPALLPMLTDKDTKIRLSAIGILSQMRSPEVAAAMGKPLRDSEVTVRRAAGQYFQQGPKDAKPVLAALAQNLSDSDGQVRSQAVNILRAFGSEAIPELLPVLKNGPVEAQITVVGLIAAFPSAGKQAIPLLAERARTEHVMLRLVSLDALIKMLPESLPSLKALQTAKDPATRLATATALHRAGPAAKDAIEVLIPALTDSDDRVRKMAAATITRVGPAALPALTRLIEDKNAEVRVAALDAWAKIGPAGKETLASLRKLMKDPQPEVRAASIRLLVRSVPSGPDAREFLEPLLFALSDKDWQTRRSASLALTKVGPASVGGLIEVLENSEHSAARAEAMLALGSIGPSAKTAIKPLIETLRDPAHGHLHTSALSALANMIPEASTALAGLLADRDTGVRVIGINALSPVQAGIAKDALVKMLRDPADEVRSASARALARSGSGVVQDVEPLLADPKAEVRAAAIQTIGPFTTLATLSKLLRDNDAAVHQAAAAFLAKRGSEAFPALAEALRSKSFRAEGAAANALVLMQDRADDLIPVLVEVLLANETQAPEAVARAILRVNPAYGARELASKVQVAKLTQLMKKAGFLEKEHPEVQELVCLALAEQGAGAKEALPVLTELLKNPRTEVNVLCAAARAVHAIGPKDAAFQLAPDLVSRIVDGVHEKSSRLREDGMSDLMQPGLKKETFEAIVTMLALDVGADEANEWIIHHANATNAWNLAGPNLVRVLALFKARGKLGPRRLTPNAEEALKAHLWRYLHEPVSGKSPAILPRPLAEVATVLPIDKLPAMTSAYLALDLLKDDPEYKSRKIHGRALQDYYEEWTLWWSEWAKHRSLHGLWSEPGFNAHQAFIWPNLLNMVDLASDPLVKQRFKMLLDLTMIEEEQISIQGTRAGRRGKPNEVGSNLDAWKDLMFGEQPRRFTDANINYRAIYWTTTYQLPPAAILLRKLNRPVSHYAIANHHYYGGSVSAFAAPHYLLGSQISQPKGTQEFPGVWHRLVFDDMNAILFPLEGGGRQHLQHKNVYITRCSSTDHPLIDFTAALKTIERDGWIFVSNGPAFAGVHIVGGHRLVRSDRKELRRQNCDSIFARSAGAFVVLQAGDVQTFGSFEKFQEAILKASLKATDDSVHYTGPKLPAIEFFRDPAKASLVSGVPQPLQSETKRYESPYLQAEVGQTRVIVSVGEYSAVYDFENSKITENKRAKR